ncbi:MAG: hypothetical protein GX215_07465 [Clostridiales Family XIII bacterium]|jgi:hypothetical protein|nr:hypothetical protein [Clostridiales Family XIII bacterium]
MEWQLGPPLRQKPGAKAEDLFHLDLAYSPPYSTARDPVMYTRMILESAIRKFEREINKYKK